MVDTTRKLGGIYVKREALYSSYVYDNAWKSASLDETLTSLSKETLKTWKFAKHSVDPTKPEVAFTNAVAHICNDGSAPHSVTVAGFGPFESLSYNATGHRLMQDPKYGRISSSATASELGGKSLFEIVASCFREKDNPPSITVHTDATACAVGEFILRSLDEFPRNQRLSQKDTIAFFLFTKGVGGAFLRGGNVHYGFLHSEMGQVPVILHPKDRNSRGRSANEVYPSLENFASEDRLLKRLTEEAKTNFPDRMGKEAINVQAHYVAQLCLSCSFVVSPSVIVLGGTMFDNFGLLDKVRRTYEHLLGDGENIPRQWFDNLGVELEHFIQKPSVSEPGTVGTLGLAASALRRWGRQS